MEGGLGLPREQCLSQQPQPGTQEPEWFFLWGCPCTRDFLQPSRGCLKSKYCKALPGLHLTSRGEKKYPGKLFWSHMSLKWKISAELISAGGVKGGEAQLLLALQHGQTDGQTGRNPCLPRGQGWIWQRLRWGERQPEPRAVQGWDAGMQLPTRWPLPPLSPLPARE